MWPPRHDGAVLADTPSRKQALEAILLITVKVRIATHSPHVHRPRSVFSDRHGLNGATAKALICSYGVSML